MTSIYEILRRPIETEKSRHQNGKLHQYVFEVDRRATKGQIKEAIQTLFDVEVQKVNVIVVPAKRGRRGKTGRRTVIRSQEYKKAVVTIRADQSIDVFEGVKG
jgi:large subunit ribosomal protein L23